MKRRLISLLIAVLLLAALSGQALAAGALVIDDGAGLLTEEERQALAGRYAEITDYIENAAFVTTDRNSGSTSGFAERYAIEHYGNDPAVIFIIDMDNREIYIYANGPALKTLSKADSRAITDNVYKLASRGDYYGCSDAVFSQILAKCQGARLARPVKHITNALIAVLLGVLVNYLITAASRAPRAERRTKGSVTAGIEPRKALLPGIMLAAPIVIGTARHYKERSSGGGGGGGGGGGHSGGGGGHSF